MRRVNPEPPPSARPPAPLPDGASAARAGPDRSFTESASHEPRASAGDRSAKGPVAPAASASSTALPAAMLDEHGAAFIERLVARDGRAFEELVLAYHRRVFALVHRMLGNTAEAEDVSQDVFVQVFRAVGTFRGESKLSTWIFRIAVNLCKNRSKYLRVRHADEQDELEAIAERVPMSEAQKSTMSRVGRPDETVAGRQVEAVVKRAIYQLEPTFRECLVLRDVEELSYEEIGEITGLPPGTVKSRIHRARAQVRAVIERELGENVR
jgi:RNA polymerase sigma-70 factor (ECF subfamily)